MSLLATMIETEGRTRVFFDCRNTEADARDVLQIEQAMSRARDAATCDAAPPSVEDSPARAIAA